MEIKFGTKTLAAGTRTSAAGPLRISTSGSVQITSLIRSRNAKAFNRLNYRTDISFGCDELFGTLKEAEEAIEYRAEELKTLGTQNLVITNTAEVSVRTLNSAKLVSCSCSYRGLTAHFEYTFSGESLTT